MPWWGERKRDLLLCWPHSPVRASRSTTGNPVVSRLDSPFASRRRPSPRAAATGLSVRRSRFYKRDTTARADDARRRESRAPRPAKCPVPRADRNPRRARHDFGRARSISCRAQRLSARANRTWCRARHIMSRAHVLSRCARDTTSRARRTRHARVTLCTARATLRHARNALLRGKTHFPPSAFTIPPKRSLLLVGRRDYHVRCVTASM